MNATPSGAAYNDFALVALAPADAARVNPTVPALGGPIGVDTDGLRKGEPVVSYSPNDGQAVQTGTSLGDDAERPAPLRRHRGRRASPATPAAASSTATAPRSACSPPSSTTRSTATA